jgi:hypothetical protein
VRAAHSGENVHEERNSHDVRVLGAVLVTGCMQARIEESREMATPIAKGERVVILAKPQIEGAGAEDDFMDCVGHSLNGGRNGVAVHDNNDFVDKMFPCSSRARPQASPKPWPRCLPVRVLPRR